MDYFTYFKTEITYVWELELVIQLGGKNIRTPA